MNHLLQVYGRADMKDRHERSLLREASVSEPFVEPKLATPLPGSKIRVWLHPSIWAYPLTPRLERLMRDSHINIYVLVENSVEFLTASLG